MRKILISIIFLLINTNTLADKKFEKDLVNYLEKLF
jgi:hypothetical protein